MLFWLEMIFHLPFHQFSPLRFGEKRQPERNRSVWRSLDLFRRKNCQKLRKVSTISGENPENTLSGTPRL